MNRLVTTCVTILFSLCVFLAEVDEINKTMVHCNSSEKFNSLNSVFIRDKVTNITEWTIADDDVINPMLIRILDHNGTTCIETWIYPGASI